jgi:glycosyltransferase involved in cell wall biosynthesis
MAESNPFKVLFDHQIFSLQKTGGISRYFDELSKNLPDYGVDATISAKYGENQFLPRLKNVLGTKALPFKVRSRINEVANRAHSLREIASHRYDVFHPTYYSTYCLKSQPPMAITIYDLIPLRFSGAIRKHVLAHNMRKLANAAAKVITISQTTKDDIVSFLNVDSQKIEVVHLATSINGQIPAEIASIDFPFFLFVGERGHYKNFDLLAKAFARLALTNVKLLCVGGGVFTDAERQNFESLNISDQVIQQRLTDAELAWAYQNCTAFIFPSIFEGFGIPALESMQMNSVTLLYDQPCFREIARDGAAYFKTEDELATLMQSAIRSKADFNQFSKNGIEVLKSYSWQITAKKTAEIYRSLRR